jgi:hypothetical protein
MKRSMYAGLFFLSLSLLMLEIVYSRTARVAFGYEYQLLVISLAISGIGFGGIPVYFIGKKIERWFTGLLVSITVMYAVLIPLPFVFVRNLGVEYALSNLAAAKTYFGVSFTTMGQFSLAVFFVYFLGGVVIAAFLRFNHDRIPQTVFLNLAGSAAGAGAVVPLLDYFGTETTVVLIYAITLASVFFFASRLARKVVYLTGLTLFAIGSIAVLAYFSPYFKAGGDNKTAVVIGSNSFSQIEVNQIQPAGVAKGLSPTYRKEINPGVKAYNLVYERKLKSNAIVFTRLSDTGYLTYDLFSFPYILKKHSDILIIGAGGGADVVRARLADSRKITALEMNPLMIDIAVNKLKTTAYDDKSVDLVVSEARNYVNRSADKYDLIYLPNTGGFGGRSVNALYLPDNYLHTREAHVTYLDRLNPDGILAISNRDVVVKDLMGVSISALKEKGIETAGHIALIKALGFSLVMVKPDGFSPAERATIAKNARRLLFEVSFPKSAPTATGEDHPITDDRPFLSATDVLKNILNPPAATGEDVNPTILLYGALDMGDASGGADGGQDSIVQNNDGDGFLALRFLAILAVFSFLAVVLLMLTPPFFTRVRAGKKSWQVLGLLGFAAFLGLGYMVFQLVIIQRAVLFIAHPTYSIALVLFLFLFFGGLGSLATRKINSAGFKSSVIGIVVMLASLLLAYTFYMNYIFFDLLHVSVGVRVVLCVGLLAPSCFLAGILFPIGLETANLTHKELIPWMWSVNGLAIVLGGALGALGSFFIGFRFVMGMAAIFYLAAMFLYLAVKPAGQELPGKQ